MVNLEMMVGCNVCLHLIQKCTLYMEQRSAGKTLQVKMLLTRRMFHVQCKFLDEMKAHIAAHHHFQIDHTKTVLYGYCEQCQNAQQKKES